jgi:alpha-N-arabinofuranosidase
MLAEGGTEYGHMETMQRSRSIYGPFEKCPHNPILSHRDTPGPIQATGHADLVQDQNGNWWLVCLAIRPIKNMQLHHIGRESFLAPVIWNENEWPIVGNGGTIDFEMEGPLPGPAPQPVSYDFSDSFDKDTLDLKWSFLRNPIRENYILQKGSILLKGGADELSTPLGQPTMIALRQEQFNIEATLALKGEIEQSQCSGLSAFYNSEYHYDIFITKEQGRCAVCLRKRVADIDVIVAYCPIDYSGKIKLKVVANDEWYTFLYERNGEFVELGKGATSLLCTEVNGRSFTGTFLGAFSEHGDIAITNFNLKAL